MPDNERWTGLFARCLLCAAFVGLAGWGCSDLPEGSCLNEEQRLASVVTLQVPPCLDPTMEYVLELALSWRPSPEALFAQLKDAAPDSCRVWGTYTYVDFGSFYQNWRHQSDMVCPGGTVAGGLVLLSDDEDREENNRYLDTTTLTGTQVAFISDQGDSVAFDGAVRSWLYDGHFGRSLFDRWDLSYAGRLPIGDVGSVTMEVEYETPVEEETAHRGSVTAAWADVEFEATFKLEGPNTLAVPWMDDPSCRDTPWSVGGVVRWSAGGDAGLLELRALDTAGYVERAWASDEDDPNPRRCGNCVEVYEADDFLGFWCGI